MSQIAPHAAPPAATPAPAAPQRSLPDLLTANVADTVAALGALIQAQDRRLVLGPALDRLADPLRRAGLTVGTAGRVGPDGPQDGPQDGPRDGSENLSAMAAPVQFRTLPRRDGQPTDLTDLTLDLGQDGTAPLARLELTDAPATWDTRARRAAAAPLARLLLRQLLALHSGVAVLAPPMLALLERLREFDDAAASHLVTGFLRVLAGGQPSQVEVTALCIAGLSDMPLAYRSKTEVVLNTVAQGLLDTLGLGQDGGHDPRTDPATATEMSLAGITPQRPALGLMPFAQLHLLERNFAVAEDDASGRLWFRPMDGGTGADWDLLDSRTVDGWTVIATEILGKTLDIQRAFATMHVIRRRDIATDEVAEIYDLHGLIWWLRHGEAGPEARLDGGQWSAYPAPAGLEGKPRAVEALFHLMPNLSSLLGHKAQDWANRMAQAVHVAPVLVQAAE